jgi:hypothetical protein
MRQASAIAHGRGTSAGQPRLLAPNPPPGLHDPIKEVAAAVQAVLAELRGRTLAHTRSRSESDCQLVVGNLLSARHAESLPPGTRVVQVAPETVVTPVARDILKHMGVTIRLVSSIDSLTASARGEWAFAIEVETGMTQAVRRALLDDPLPWTELGSSLQAVISWLLEEPGRGAMLLTSDAAVAVWKSCRVPGVRAASAAEPADVGRAVATLGVNLLVVEPADKSISWMRQLGTAFRQSGGPVVPQSLELGGW